MLAHADAGLPQAVPRFSSVTFTAMVVIVVTGILQGWRQVGSLQALGQNAYGRLLVAKVAVFLLLIAVAGRSRVLVRRKLMARASVGAAAPDRDRGDVARPRVGDIDGGSLWRCAGWS